MGCREAGQDEKSRERFVCMIAGLRIFLNMHEHLKNRLAMEKTVLDKEMFHEDAGDSENCKEVGC